jgi:hypothetical protein
MSDMKGSWVHAWFSAELRKRLRSAAARKKTRESDLIRAAVERQLTAEEDELTAYERAKKAGLIGAVRGARRDLSTKARHFEGFGALEGLSTRRHGSYRIRLIP